MTNPQLPPKCPFPASFVGSSSINCIGPKGNPIARDGVRFHQRTASESFLLEEQPSWLDELLREPEIAVGRRDHRRSSSDSFVFLDSSDSSWNGDGSNAVAFWGPQELDYLKQIQHAPHYLDANSYRGTQIEGADSSNNMVNYPISRLPPAKDKLAPSFSASVTKKQDGLPSFVMDSHVPEECGKEKPIGCFERREGAEAKHYQSEMEAKRAKQQFAQRSRMRKLQYIAELERSVQMLQAESLELSSQLQFLDQQNHMLSLENKTLLQQLDCLSHEHLLKCLEHDILGKELSRLRHMHLQQQQQQQQQRLPTHGRKKSIDLNSQLANLSLKGNDSNSGVGQLHI
ncbi:uncharacterized protein At4g06598-like [Zingiber officinale]|uniref:uncharacterized protein At4g06598-like n=1 Tax=Zingiber officinale TaxID=94328 RepID=UPI001C4C182F|nr:uncharacterized protein At4g06598-like [Zingiber officinale]XP_042464874.1 uncharacterized protein At4g06598-like [Zingiber officinale]